MNNANAALINFETADTQIVQGDLDYIKTGARMPRHVDLYNWLCLKFKRPDLLDISEYAVLKAVIAESIHSGGIDYLDALLEPLSKTTTAAADTCIDIKNKIPLGDRKPFTRGLAEMMAVIRASPPGKIVFLLPVQRPQVRVLPGNRTSKLLSSRCCIPRVIQWRRNYGMTLVRKNNFQDQFVEPLPKHVNRPQHKEV